MIRTARNTELDKMIELYKHLHRADVHAQLDDLRRVWTEMLESQFLHCFVTEEDDQLVSSCVLVLVPNLTRGAKPYGLIENVVTHTDHRNRGLATRLIQYVLNFAWQRGAYKVMLLTGSKNPAVHRLYEKVGFNGHSKKGYVIANPRV